MLNFFSPFSSNKYENNSNQPNPQFFLNKILYNAGMNLLFPKGGGIIRKLFGDDQERYK